MDIHFKIFGIILDNYCNLIYQLFISIVRESLNNSFLYVIMSSSISIKGGLSMELWHIIFWAVLTVFLIGVEIATVQLVSVWFGAGSLVAFISSFFISDFYIQVIIFIVVSIILLLATRPLARKFINKNGHVKTNSDSLIGKKCIVKEPVNNLLGTGKVFVDGLLWSAKSASPDFIFHADETCIVTDIQGVKLIIQSLDSNV